MMMTLKTNSFLALILTSALLLLGACSTSNQTTSVEGEGELPANYPNKPITALVGYAPGGGQDLIMRTTGQILNEEGIMEQPFVIQNKPGAGGRIAMEEIAKGKSDPYKLIVVPEYGSGWDPRVDLAFTEFKPIASLATSEIFIITQKDSPYQSIEDLLEGLKKDSSLTISTLGPVDGGEAFKWDQVRELAGVEKLNYVPMAGASESFTAVLSGQVDTTFGVLPVIKDYLQTGEIRALAVLSEERSTDLPDVPTLKESGIDLIFQRYTGIWTGAEVPDAVIQYWEDRLKTMSETEAWQEFLDKRLLKSFYMESEDYTTMIEADGTDFKEYVENLEK